MLRSLDVRHIPGVLSSLLSTITITIVSDGIIINTVIVTVSVAVPATVTVAAALVSSAAPYCSGASDRNYHQKTMISDFKLTCLCQKFDFRDGQRQFGCAGSLCVKV